MKRRQPILLLIVIGMIGGLPGCGLAPLTLTLPTKPISVLFLNTLPTSLAIKASTPVMAGITNDTSNPLISWAVTCGSPGACGSFTSSTSVSGGPNTYIAPSAIPTGGTVTVTATSAADTTKSVSATITITPPIPIAVSFQGIPPASLQINATTAISVIITNDVSANPQVQWTVTCASAACGSFNPTTTGSYVVANYIAPSAIPSGNTVTVTATSVTDPTKSISASIGITGTARTLANGTYVFQLTGPVASGSDFITGVITARDGAIIGGEQDSVSYSSDQDGDASYLPQFVPITGGSYATTPDGNLQITLKSNEFYFNSEQDETLNGVIVSGSRVMVEEINGSAANGSLELQTAMAAPSGGYAFSASGVDSYGVGAGAGGILNVDSVGGISGAGSVLDFNDQGTFLSAQSLAASTVSSPDSFGRVVFHLLPRTPASFPSLYFAGYIVDATHIRLVETSGDGFMGVLGGTALAQGASTGKFTGNSLAGSSYVFVVAGWPTNDSGSLQVAGMFTANADGSLAGMLNWNNLTEQEPQSPIAFTGSCTVDPTGRATLSNLTDGATFKYQWQLYLTGDGHGLVLSSSAAQVIAGQAFQQQPGPFTAASFSGSYGLNAAQFGINRFNPLGVTTVLGPLTVVADNGNTLTGFVDFGYGATDYAVSGSFTAGANGVFTGTMAGLNPGSVTTPDSFTLYFVDPTRAVIIETDNTQLTLGYLELQQ